MSSASGGEEGSSAPVNAQSEHKPFGRRPGRTAPHSAQRARVAADGSFAFTCFPFMQGKNCLKVGRFLDPNRATCEPHNRISAPEHRNQMADFFVDFRRAADRVGDLFA
jgi:hypothetical protein